MFAFKQFTIQQQHNAMKVTTDACLFGALVAANEPADAPAHWLDAGAGTGLLSLMVAQQHPLATLHAVELQEAAAREAAANIAASPWQARIQLQHGDVLQLPTTPVYQVIISNPPFHQHQLQGPNEARNLAHHHQSLALRELLQLAATTLLPDGRLWLLLPAYRHAELLTEATAARLPVTAVWWMVVKAGKPSSRIIACLQNHQQEKASGEATITIADENNVYTPAFETLLRPFYLKL